jgi:hypothetical protein
VVVVGRVVVGLQLPVQSVPITTKVVRLNTAHGAVYSIQHYVLKFVSDLRQVGGTTSTRGTKIRQLSKACSLKID